MTRLLCSFILVSTAALTFISCNGDNRSQHLPVTRDSSADQPGALVNSPGSYAVEPGPSPVIIRSAVPPGFYGYAPDTSQVSQYIRRIFQDTKGNLWFGTVGDGACRFDGKYLTYYTTREGFGGNSVQDIAEDREGNIWFATSGGLSKYDARQPASGSGRYRETGDTGRFINFTEKDGLGDRHISSLFIDRSGTIWMGTPSGVFRYHPAETPESGEDIFTSFPIPESGEKLEVRNMIEDKAGNIWLATHGGGVYRYGGGSLTHITEKEGLGSNIVRCILEDKNGIMWFATKGGGLCRYDPSAAFRPGNGAFTSYADKKGSNEAERLFEDKAGKLWVSVRGGVRRYDLSASPGNVGQPLTTFTTADGLTNCCVQSICEDRAGNLWLGSGAGLFRFDKRRANHPCSKNTCQHDLGTAQGLQAHQLELAKTIVNVTKKGPWPQYFR